MTLLYSDTSSNTVAVNLTKATAYCNRIVCVLYTNNRLEVTLPSSTVAKEAVVKLAKEGYYDARRYKVREYR